jgi:hypothetical protein
VRRFAQMCFDDLGDINNLVILLCRDGDCLHFKAKHFTFVNFVSNSISFES